MTVHPGWNLIGVSEPVTLPTRPDLPHFAWEPVGNGRSTSYRIARELDPKVAYWLYWYGTEGTADIEFTPRP